MKLKKYLVSGVVLTAVLILAGALALRQPVRENVTPPGAGAVTKYMEYPNTDYNNQGDLTSMGGATVETCSALCNRTKDCTGFRLNNTGNCHVKSDAIKTPSEVGNGSFYYKAGSAPPGKTLPSGAGDATNTPVTNTATGKPLTPVEKATAEAAAAKAAADKLAADKLAAEKTAPFKDELFGFEFKDEKQAKMVYGGAGIALLLIIGGVLMFVLRKRPAPRPMYGMGRRRH